MGSFLCVEKCSYVVVDEVVFYERGLSRINFACDGCLRAFLQQPALNLPIEYATIA